MRGERRQSETTASINESSGYHEKRLLAIRWCFPRGIDVVSLLTDARCTIGRDAKCGIVLDSSSVSRRHAEVYRQGPIFCLKDLGSKNGVHVDGELRAHAPLRPGQLLRIGDFIGFVTVTDGSSDTRPFEEIAPGVRGGEVMRRALAPVARAAQHGLPIIVEGETGTGKEVVARAIHAWSKREGPFHAVNCAALPGPLVEAELFGFRRGAFTGAVESRTGHVRSAHRGTLFLDEIVDMPLEAQAKLLRVIVEGEVCPIGETRPIPVDVRFVCACQTGIRRGVERGTFRPDLHARLSGYTCKLPPLRDRREDIPGLFATFLDRFSGGVEPSVDPRLIEALCLYGWRDNVRELELLTQRLMVLHGGEKQLKRRFLPEHVVSSVRVEAETERPNAPDRRADELGRLTAALRRSGGNIARAAANLGLSRQRVYRLMAGRSAAELMEADSPRETPSGER